MQGPLFYITFLTFQHIGILQSVMRLATDEGEVGAVKPV